jgi:hypothetical protein
MNVGRTAEGVSVVSDIECWLFVTAEGENPERKIFSRV